MLPGSTQAISAIVFGPGKVPVKDGTLVSFSTTLSALIPNQAATLGGVAAVQLAAGATPGTAQVSATAGSVASDLLEITIGNVVYLPLVLK